MAQKQVYSQQLTTFDYSSADQNTSLFLAIKFFDVTSGTASLLATVGMTSFFGGSYFVNYTFPVSLSGHSIAYNISAYTDNTYTTLATLAPASDTFIVDGVGLVAGRAG